MRIRYGAVLIVLAACLPGSAWAAGNLTVQTQHLDRKTANYEITMLYPSTGVAAIDAQVADWAKAQADWFAHSAADKRPQDPPYSLDVSYTILRNDRQMFEAMFEFDSYTGGAHPNQELHTLNFLLPDGARVFLAEIVGSDGIARVSELATASLIKELAEGAEPVTDADTIRRGTTAHPGSFETFTITKNSLILYFSPYEVAAYAAGPQMTEIPLAKLTTVMRSDWRAPQPSFECDKAATAVEKGLCADVTLARLDRQLAEAYYWQMQLAENDADKTRARDRQRAFLASRDAACGAEAGGALTQCLTGAYRTRLKAFEQQPR